jgi:cytochrome P450
MGPNKLHAERKRMLFPLFSNTYVQTSSEVTKILDTILSERLIPQMRMWAQNKSVVDIHRENKAAMMDITTAYLFGLGNETNFLLDPKEKATLTLFEQGVSALFWMTELPTLVKLCSLLRIPLLSNEVLTSFQSIEIMVAKICDRTKQSLLETKEPHTSLYAQLREKLEPTIAGLDLDQSVAAEMMDSVQAGHEGPAITVTYVMCELSRNSEVLSRLQRELSSLDARPTAQDIENLPLLEAVLLETMRRYPAAFGPFPRNVPMKGSNLGGFDVPGGTIVSASTYCLHNNSAVFPKPDQWLPDRWIAASAEQRKSMNKWLWVFGSGSRMCIGSHLAIRSMLIMFPAGGFIS